MEKNILDINTVELDENDNSIIIIDQTLLPGRTELIKLKTAQEIWDAIYLLQVRGAPAIGVAAGFGIYVLTKDYADNLSDAQKNDDSVINEFYSNFVRNKDYINSSRPTAVNLSWALNRMDKVCRNILMDESSKKIAMAKDVLSSEAFLSSGCKDVISYVVKELHDEAIAIQEEDIWTCKMIGEYGLSLLKPGDGILTHCNAGQLATSKYGTATAPIYLGHERGYNFKVFADETRPLLQGARLTSYELHSAGVDVTLICDNMACMVMKNGWVNAVFVGCDRVAANGDAANKIGTSGVATIAKRFNIPFYICAPSSTIDMNTPTGDDIHIEERKPEEVTKMWYKEPMAPDGIKVFNPAFDVTDHEYITAIITEYGIARAPYTESLKEIFDKKSGVKNE